MPVDPSELRALLATLDLTSLGENDDRRHIADLCAAADSRHGAPAAICVYPEWVDRVRSEIQTRGLATRVASVINFPDGSANTDRIERETRRTVAAGADEIDMVLPWRAVIANDFGTAEQAVAAARAAAPGRLLKVIVESGELNPEQLRRAGELALQAGADFLKTSTGKGAHGASLAAADILLELIAAHGCRHGFKASGGIRRVSDALPYLRLARERMGADWCTAAHFRIGASTLLQDLLAQLDGVGAGAV
jgi:deoxyribose-phosphate aldolase